MRLRIDQFIEDYFFRTLPDIVHLAQNPNLKEIQTFGEES